MQPIDKEDICCEHANLEEMGIPKSPGLAADQKGVLLEFLSVAKAHDA